MERHISRSDGHIGEENRYSILQEDGFADTWRCRSIAADVSDEAERVKIVRQKSKQTW